VDEILLENTLCVSGLRGGPAATGRASCFVHAVMPPQLLCVAAAGPSSSTSSSSGRRVACYALGDQLPEPAAALLAAAAAASPGPGPAVVGMMLRFGSPSPTGTGAGAAGAASLPWPALREGAAATELQLDLGGLPLLRRLFLRVPQVAWAPFIAPAHTPEVGCREHTFVQAPSHPLPQRPGFAAVALPSHFSPSKMAPQLRWPFLGVQLWGGASSSTGLHSSEAASCCELGYTVGLQKIVRSKCFTGKATSFQGFLK
jgi:hypothetical protein